MKRRSASEGSIFHRPDGRWEARMQVGYRGGSRLRKSYYGRTRREVQDKLVAAQRALQLGVVPVDERQRVGDYLQWWLLDKKSTVRASTWASYEGIVRLHLIPSLGRVPLAKLTPGHVNALLTEKLAQGLSSRRVQYIHAVIRHALTQAVRLEIVSRNVAVQVTPPRVKQYQVRPLTEDEARRLLQAAKGERFEALYVLSVCTGLRQGEALALQWADLDLDTAELAIRGSLQRINGSLVIAEPKTERSRRTVKLPQLAVEALRVHRRRQGEDRLKAGSKWQDHGFIFATAKGTPFDASGVTRDFHALLAKAGLPRVRFHDLRHTSATLMMVNGVHPRTVMEILGHSQIGLTMNTYSHVTPSLMADAADRLDLLLGRDKAS